MTEAEFIRKTIAAFVADHPAADGWKVMRIDPNIPQTFLPQLPAFVRAKLPGAFKEAIVTDFGYASKTTRRARRSRLTAMPRRQRGKGIDEGDWVGDISFDWLGSPIQYRRVWLPKKEGILPQSHTLSLVAHKDDAALEDFYQAGMKFVARRKSALKTQVWVVNGPNYPRPKATWEDLILPAELKSQIRDSFEAFIAAKEHYKKLGLPYRRGFLLVGPPGNGKTMVTKIIGGSYPVNMVSLILKSDLDERIVDEAFRVACSNPPCVLILEDLDKIINASRVSLSYLLNKLDGMDAPEGALVVATTNEPQRLDPALLHRPSRFDRVWEFKLPEYSERLAMLTMRAGKYFSPPALETAAKDMHGFSMAYVQEAVVSSMMMSIQSNSELCDEHLSKCVLQLRAQIKSATTGSSPIGGTGQVGFFPNGDSHVA